MVELLATSVISCSDAFRIVNRIGNVIGLSYQQKMILIGILSDDGKRI